MKRFIMVILLVAAIPVAGWSVGNYVEHELQEGWRSAVVAKFGSEGASAIAAGKISFQKLCSSGAGASLSPCHTQAHVVLLQKASLIALGVGFGLLLFIFILGRLASINRNMLLFIFAPAIKVILLVLFGHILVQGLIATYAAYIFEVTAVGSVHFILIGGILVSAVLGSLFMISEGMSISKVESVTILGKAVSPAMQPRLWEFVSKLAQRVGAAPPDNIVVGLEPNFYVTSADVTPFPTDDRQTGETLYLSLPLMRMLSIDELASVVGHELGHFSGEDTKFSLSFYPIYAGTSQALGALHYTSQSSSGPSLALLPAAVILSFFMEQFERAEKAFGREREFVADRVGASVSSAQDMAMALLKVGAFRPLWTSLWSDIVDRKVPTPYRDRIHDNVSSVYAELASSVPQRDCLNTDVAAPIPHPSDTHPPTGARIEALGLSFDDLKEHAFALDLDASSAMLVMDLTSVEQALTRAEHEWRNTARRQ